MTKKQTFLNEVLALAGDAPEKVFSSDALDYWNALQEENKKTNQFTENGKLILDFLQKNKDVYNNLFKAKDVGEGIGISSKTASGAMRKLVTDGYIEKVGTNPVIYTLTELGIKTNVNAES